MTKFLLVVLLFLLGLFMILPNLTEAYTRVRGYYRKDGTYVMPHYRTNPNKYKWDNWSSWGNYNPFTGRKGYKRAW